MKEQIKASLIKLLSVPGCTGLENAVADAIEEMVKPFVDEISRDAMGNLICVKKGKGPRLMFSAHMDQIGLVVTDIDENGFLWVNRLGGLAPQSIYGRHIVFSGGVRGVVARWSKPDDDKWTYDRMYVDVGATTREEAEKLVSVGSIASVVPEQSLLANDRIASPAMDDRAGCAVLVETLRNMGDVPCEVIAVFSTQEEVGLRGARAAAWAAKPDIGISLDVTLVGDTPESGRNACKLGGGAAVKILDGGMISAPVVVKHMISLCESKSIKYQREVLTGGTTDATAMQLVHAGVPVGCISIPCRYVHSMAETIDMADMVDSVKLAVAMAQDPVKV